MAGLVAWLGTSTVTDWIQAGSSLVTLGLTLYLVRRANAEARERTMVGEPAVDLHGVRLPDRAASLTAEIWHAGPARVVITTVELIEPPAPAILVHGVVDRGRSVRVDAWLSEFWTREGHLAPDKVPLRIENLPADQDVTVRLTARMIEPRIREVHLVAKVKWTVTAG